MSNVVQMKVDRYWRGQAWAAEVAQEAGLIFGPSGEKVMKEIVGQVSAHTGVAVKKIMGKRRGVDRVATARQYAMYLIRKLGYPLEEIGGFFKRHHTSVMHGIDRIERMLETGE